MYVDRTCQEVQWQSTEWRLDYGGGTGGGKDHIQDVPTD